MGRAFRNLSISKKMFVAPIVGIVIIFILWAGFSLLVFQQKPAEAGIPGFFIISIFILCAGIFLPLFLATILVKDVAGRIHTTVETMDRISRGDLTERAKIVTSEDDLGHLQERFNVSVERLYGTIMQVADSSNHVSYAADSLENSTGEISAGLDSTASQVNSMAVASEEMSSTLSEIAQNCVRAVKSSEGANGATVTGAANIEETVRVMDRINDMVKGTAQIIRSLGDKSDKIGEVVELINSIADQTNLLALNAAIEAARAGEHGRGFAVVADEVRKLAEGTTEATKEINETILAIQQETKKAVTAMDAGVEEAHTGQVEAEKSKRSLDDILSQIHTVTGEINQIAIACEQQTAATNEISGNIQRVSEVMQQTARKVQENAGASAELAAFAASLRDLVGRFRLASEEEVKEMVKKAVAYARTQGKEKSFAEFNDPRGQFVKGELYVYVRRFDGVTLAHGAVRKLIGKNHMNVKDAAGKYYVREQIDTAKNTGSGWVRFETKNPATKKVQPKIAYVEKVDDYLIGCAVFV